jgi:hypothetical protein
VPAYHAPAPSSGGRLQISPVPVEILGFNVTTNALSWVNYDGPVTAAVLADNTAANAITGPNGQTTPTTHSPLAQAKNLLKLPPLNGGRAPR